MTLDFLKDAANVILIGPNGVGKTTLAKNIAYQALIAGHTVLFATAGQLLGDLAAMESDSALRRRLRHYVAPDFLPYTLQFVGTNGSLTIYEYSSTLNHDQLKSRVVGVSCGRTRTTPMVMDHGLVHLTVLENADGRLKLVFSRPQRTSRLLPPHRIPISAVVIPARKRPGSVA